MNQCKMCGACCIAPSISSIIPGLNRGKKAGEKCIHLTENNLCGIFQSPDRPKVCGDFQPDILFCGTNQAEGIKNMTAVENGVF